ncbi:kinase-like domain-containing protein [Paraphoma chrysanthemicola]|nr:kinase-like domain-containing protein [Paraphoma chrysanthemicola]
MPVNNFHDELMKSQQLATSNPWGAFVPHWTLDGYQDPPTDNSTLEKAQSGWKRMFGEGEISLTVRDAVPFTQGAMLGKGGLGVVHETHIDGVAVAWKRTYVRQITNIDRNEIRILGQVSERRHRHIITLIGAYTHRQRGAHEISILIWPVARCDLSVLLHEVDLLDIWKSRDQTWDATDWAAQPTNDEKDAYDSLLKLEGLDQERFKTFTWQLRHKVRDAVSLRLTHAIGCIAEAVKYLHSNGIRHKDLKPSQILLSAQGLWLTDFGMSKDISHLTSSETSGGEKATVRYHAPERANMLHCGRPEDIFALGCTYLEMAFRIYGIEAKRYVNPEGASMWSYQGALDAIHTWLSPITEVGGRPCQALCNIIEQMMTKHPQDRLSIDGVIAQLSAVSSWSDHIFCGPCCNLAGGKGQNKIVEDEMPGTAKHYNEDQVSVQNPPASTGLPIHTSFPPHALTDTVSWDTNELCEKDKVSDFPKHNFVARGYRSRIDSSPPEAKLQEREGRLNVLHFGKPWASFLRARQRPKRKTSAEVTVSNDDSDADVESRSSDTESEPDTPSQTDTTDTVEGAESFEGVRTKHFDRHPWINRREYDPCIERVFSANQDNLAHQQALQPRNQPLLLGSTQEETPAPNTQDNKPVYGIELRIIPFTSQPSILQPPRPEKELAAKPQRVEWECGDDDPIPVTCSLCPHLSFSGDMAHEYLTQHIEDFHAVNIELD